MPPFTLVPLTLSITDSLLLPAALAGPHRGPSGSSLADALAWPGVLVSCDPVRPGVLAFWRPGAFASFTSGAVPLGQRRRQSAQIRQECLILPFMGPDYPDNLTKPQPCPSLLHTPVHRA